MGGAYQRFAQTFCMVVNTELETEWANLESTATGLRELAGIPGQVQDREAAFMLTDLTRALRSFLWFRGYWDERVRLSEWTYQAAHALNAWQLAGWSAYDVASTYLYRSDTELAATWADRCAEAMERTGYRSDKVASMHLQGQIAEQRNDLNRAERHYTEALVGCRSANDQEAEATILSDLGDLSKRRREQAEADRYYRQAMLIAEQIGNKELQANFAGKLGKLMLEVGRIAAARTWFTHTLALARELGRQDLIASAQAGLATLLEAEQNYAEALPLARAALEVYERLRDHDLDETRKLVQRLREKIAEQPA